MEQYAAIIIDIVIVALVALFVWLQAKRGFIRTLIELIGCILAFTVAFSAANYLSDVVFEKTIRESLIAKIDDTVEENGVDNINRTVDGIWDALPSFLTASSALSGIDKDDIEDELSSAVRTSSKQAGNYITDDLLGPVIKSLLSFILSLIIITALMILVRFAARKLDNFFNLPLLGTMNAVLGGLLGFIKGSIVVFAAVVLISILMPIFQNKLWIFTPEQINETHLFKILYSFSPFGTM